ncbi:MAG: 16S rRNA (cytosine(1402)-N(4))-methyltransferase RsmH [Alphaproteobacteria bacterium]|nr:16S rRNA (cytosine(1402)-N(4))-methyltransferase RsmH [Alphaproteobacteria bacterium]
MTKHIPVLLGAILQELGDLNGRHILDATFGAGGYTRAFLNAGASVVAFDRDPNVIVDADAIKQEFGDKFRFISAPFSEMSRLTETFDAIVFDLGISSMQIDVPERGFSFRGDAPLDMRMSGAGQTAADLIAQSGVAALAKILRDYGDVSRANVLARAMVQSKPQTTFELKNLIYNPRDVAPVFQALRIAVNDEMGELRRALDVVPNLLKVGGKCLAVTFHSIEDRIVKNTFRDWSSVPGNPLIPVAADAEYKMLRVATPDAIELEQNPRSRSAHLRGVQKSY